MPLTRGSIAGYDSKRMVFRFTMISHDIKTIECEISSTAMDFLSRSRGTPPAGRQAQFLTLRDRIERLTSKVFDKNPSIPVRVFTKHLSITDGF
jgi:hypothetical protein